MLLESSGRLFGSYLVLFQNLKIWCYIFKKLNAKVTCLIHKPACKKNSHSLIFEKLNKHPHLKHSGKKLTYQSQKNKYQSRKIELLKNIAAKP